MKGQPDMTPEQDMKLRTATTWIPLAQFFGAVVFACGLVWWISNERSEIHNRVTQVSNDVQRLTVTVDKLVETISKPNSMAFSRQEWIMDCLRMQIANPSWKCPYADVNGSSHTKVMP